MTATQVLQLTAWVQSGRVYRFAPVSDATAHHEMALGGWDPNRRGLCPVLLGPSHDTVRPSELPGVGIHYAFPMPDAFFMDVESAGLPLFVFGLELDYDEEVAWLTAKLNSLPRLDSPVFPCVALASTLGDAFEDLLRDPERIDELGRAVRGRRALISVNRAWDFWHRFGSDWALAGLWGQATSHRAQWGHVFTETGASSAVGGA